jgi:hypothetical protein
MSGLDQSLELLADPLILRPSCGEPEATGMVQQRRRARFGFTLGGRRVCGAAAARGSRAALRASVVGWL